jgi:hypothetical protein
LTHKYVKPGSEIHSDQWAAYLFTCDIEVSPPFIHKTVNHSENFRDPVTSAHTNNVEAYWWAVNKGFKMLNGTNPTLTPSYLDEHMYRECYERTFESMFVNILKDIGIFVFNKPTD